MKNEIEFYTSFLLLFLIQIDENETWNKYQRYEGLIDVTPLWMLAGTPCGRGGNVYNEKLEVAT